jgi:hypothetical protein
MEIIAEQPNVKTYTLIVIDESGNALYSELSYSKDSSGKIIDKIFKNLNLEEIAEKFEINMSELKK